MDRISMVCYMLVEGPLMLHNSVFPASEGMVEYLYYLLILLKLALKSNIINDTLHVLSAFLILVIMNQHLLLQNRNVVRTCGQI